VVALTLSISLLIPWFRLPVLGWEIPAPAWNRAGLACLVLAGFHLLRAVGGPPFRWLVRIATLPALYFWWVSPEWAKAWGARHLAPAQLKLAPLNNALARLGGDTLELYKPPLWKTLEPQTGWYVAGGTLILTLLLTSFDGPNRLTCSSCKGTFTEDDRFCGECGEALKGGPHCGHCGEELNPNDKFCRRCGTES